MILKFTNIIIFTYFSKTQKFTEKGLSLPGLLKSADKKINNMEQFKHDTAAMDSEKRYSSPRTKVVFVKAQGILCMSDPSLTGYRDGSHSDGGDMEE